MNILLINHYAGSHQHGMEYRPFYLAREWVKLGHQVTIVAASYSHLRSNPPRITGNLTEEAIEGIHYIWLKTPKYQGNNFGRVLNILTFVLQLFRYHAHFIQHGHPNVVINSSTYPLDTYPAQFIAHKANATLIFEVHDLWPLTPIELGGMSPYHPLIALMQQAENSAYRRSNRVVSLLPKANIHMQAHGMATHKFAYLPNGIHLDEWTTNLTQLPLQHQATLAQLQQSGQFLVGYVGGHGIANALSFLIDAAALLKHESCLTFVLVGQGSEKEALQQKAGQHGLTNTIFLPPVPKSSVPLLLSKMDALFLGWQKQPIYRFGISPNKLMDYMMAAKPIIHSISAGNDPVAESKCGISVPAEDPPAIAEAVQQLMNQPVTVREAMGLRGRNYVMTHHDYTVLAKQFLEIMEMANHPAQALCQVSI